MYIWELFLSIDKRGLPLIKGFESKGAALREEGALEWRKNYETPLSFDFFLFIRA